MKKITYTVFVDGKPWESMTEEERNDFHDKAGARLEEVLTEWFSREHESESMQRL